MRRRIPKFYSYLNPYVVTRVLSYLLEQKHSIPTLHQHFIIQRPSLNDLLIQLGLEKYAPHFEGTTLNQFLGLTKQDLVARGITLLGPQSKLMNVIQQYQVWLPNDLSLD